MTHEWKPAKHGKGQYCFHNGGLIQINSIRDRWAVSGRVVGNGPNIFDTFDVAKNACTKYMEKTGNDHDK